MITATPDELQALLQLVQRAPMTLAETLFIEGLFLRWRGELAGPAAGDASIKPPGDSQVAGEPPDTPA